MAKGYETHTFTAAPWRHSLVRQQPCTLRLSTAEVRQIVPVTSGHPNSCYKLNRSSTQPLPSS